MKYKVSITLFVCFVIFLSNCKKDSPQNNTPVEDELDKSLFEAALLLKEIHDKFLEFAETTNGNPREAIMLSDEWVRAHDAVSSTVAIDSTYINITTAEGIRTSFYFNTYDEEGNSVYRGSGPLGSITNLTGGNCSNEITNKKVLIYGAQFIAKPHIFELFENSEVDFDVTYLKDDQCRPEIVETFKDYGLVILDTHGKPGGFLTGTTIDLGASWPTDYITFKKAVIAELGSQNYDRLVNRELSISRYASFNPFDPNWWNNNQNNVGKYYDVWVQSEYINGLPLLDSTIIFGNMCWSGHQSTEFDPFPIGAAFVNRNPISYYAYAFNNLKSQKVDSDFCHNMEDSLVRSLVIDMDSTGIAYLKSDDTEFNDSTTKQRYVNKWGPFYFKHFRSPSWCYGGCSDTIVDARDLRVYKTVCIGDQTWMAENLKYAGAGGVCYEFEAELCESHGRMYRLGELTNYQTSTDSTVVRGLCPEGWHVPSLAEYQKLFETVGGISTAGPKLMAPDYWEKPNNYTDEFDFNLRPGGYYIYDENDPEPYNWSVGGFGAAFWTSSPGNNPEDYYSIEVNEYAEIYAEIIPLYPELGYERGATCRCVKDK